MPLNHAYYQPKRESSNFAFRKDAPKTRRPNLCTTAADLGRMAGRYALCDIPAVQVMPRVVNRQNAGWWWFGWK